MTDAIVPEQYADLPPAPKLVLAALQQAEHELTTGELAATTQLAERTLQDALARLRQHGIVERRQVPHAPERFYHRLADEQTGDR